MFTYKGSPKIDSKFLYKILAKTIVAGHIIATLSVTTLATTTQTTLSSPKAEQPLSSKPLSNTSISFPTVIATSWKATAPTKQLENYLPINLVNKEVALEYGLVGTFQKEYTNGKETIALNILEFRHPIGAFGFKTFSLVQTPNTPHLVTQNYVIKVQSKNGNLPIPEDFISNLAQIISPSPESAPPLVDHLPVSEKIKGGEIYIIGPQALALNKHFGFLGESIDFQGGTEAVYAQYNIPSSPMGLLLIEYLTPQLATDGYNQISKALSSLTDISTKEQVSIKRIGNFIVLTRNGAQDEKQELIVNEIKYTAKVYWEGERYSAIPLEYRSQEAAYYEVSQTAKILLRTFYWIGIMIAFAVFLGICTGSGFFYWRRYKNTLQSVNEKYTPATGMVHVILNDNEKPKKK